MVKRSYKRPTPLEKHNASCMWAFISFFDFRRGPLTPKLLSDTKPGSSKQAGNSNSIIKLDRLSNYEDNYEDSNNTMETEAEGVDLRIASVKALIDKEMFQEYSEKNTSDEPQCIRPKLGQSSRHEKNLQQRSKRSKVTSTAHINNKKEPASLTDHLCDKITPTDCSSHNFDLVAFLIEFCSDKWPSRKILVSTDSNSDLYFAMKAIVQKINDQADEFASELDRKECILYRALTDVFKAIANQNFVDEKHLIDKAVQSKGIMDALEILESNKDVLLKLLEDSNSQLYKQIQYLQKIEAGKLTKLESENRSEKVRVLQEADISNGEGNQLGKKELLQKQNRHGFFWRKDKSKELKLSKQNENSESLSTIVVLKPTPIRAQEDLIRRVPSFSPVPHHQVNEDGGNRVVSHFSLGEIKRRLKRIIGGSRKERRVISMDGILDKIPIGYKVSVDKHQLHGNENAATSLESKSSHYTEDPAVVVPIPREKDSMVNPEECELNIRNGISVVKPSSLIYEEAKKHRPQTLDLGNKITSFPIARVSRSLGRLLSLPDYEVLSPRVRRGDEKEFVLPSQETVLLPLLQFNEEDATNSLKPLKQDLEVSSCSGDNQNVLMLDLKTELTDDCMEMKGSVQNVETVDIASKLLSDQLDLPSEPTSYEFDVACGRCNEVLVLEVQAPPVAQSELSTTSFHRRTFEGPEGAIARPGRSASVSIIERFISEDFSSPKLRAVHTLPPSTDEKTSFRTSFGDSKARAKYVEAILEASGLITIDLSERWHLADKLLDPSLFDEVGISCSLLIDDPKLLFDCTIEALEEIHDKFFKCTPWVSLLAHTAQLAPLGSRLIKEVNKRIERHIPMSLPNTIDHIVLKDLHDGSWMELQFQTEEIVIEIWDTALDDLVEEAIFDLWLDLSDDW